MRWPACPRSDPRPARSTCGSRGHWPRRPAPVGAFRSAAAWAWLFAAAGAAASLMRLMSRPVAPAITSTTSPVVAHTTRDRRAAVCRSAAAGRCFRACPIRTPRYLRRAAVASERLAWNWDGGRGSGQRGQIHRDAGAADPGRARGWPGRRSPRPPRPARSCARRDCGRPSSTGSAHGWCRAAGPGRRSGPRPCPSTSSPGATAFTFSPGRAPSSAATFISPATPCLEARRQPCRPRRPSPTSRR